MIKAAPDLNKLKFTKLHRKNRIRTVNKGNKGKLLSAYSFGLIVNKSSLIKVNQLEALKKAINRKLKTKETKNKKNFKIIKSIKKVQTAFRKKKKEKNFLLRHNLCLGLTKKPLQVRMGKGKGNPVDWVYPCAKDRLLVEFNTNTKKNNRITKIKRILIKASKKLAVKSRFTRVVTTAVKLANFNRIANFSTNKQIKIICVKEL